MRARKTQPSKRRFAKHRDKAFTDWLKQWWGCWICQQRPVEPAHVIPRSLGSDDRDNIVPMCHRHHSEQEGHTAEFEAKYGIILADCARQVTAIYDQGDWAA